MVRKLIALAVVLILGLTAKALHDTLRAPVIEDVVIESEALAPGSPPLIIALLADIHVAGPDMPPSRLEEIVDQVNALQPDLVAIAGDLVSEKRTATHIYSAEKIIAPLGALDARHGVVVVPGNHDHWFDWPALSAELARHEHITVLANEAAQLGPFAVGGVDDAFTRRDDLETTFAQLRPLKGLKLALTHSPDIFPQVPTDIKLVLAGHTHCGQIAYPWGGAPATMSEYGGRYACGVVNENGKTLVTSGGIGTSLLPIRLFTQPQIWLIEIRPAGTGEKAR